MAQQDINIGASANDGSGDPLRTAFDKTQDNFDELYSVFQTWNFAAHAGAFPTSTHLTIYVVEDDHGNPGDPDYVPAGAWMLATDAGAAAFGDFYIKP